MDDLQRFVVLNEWPRRAGNSIVYALGDSLTSQNIQTTYSYGMLGNGMSWARRLSMGSIILPIANINGGSGETAARHFDFL